MSEMSHLPGPRSERLSNCLGSGRLSVSFEFFPPKTERAARHLYESIEALAPIGPTFVSVTYGAGGTTRRRTHELVMRIHRETGLTVVPHLTCVGSTKEEVGRIVGDYASEGIGNILALRGDPPRNGGAGESMTTEPPPGGEFPYAVDLVRFIRREFPGMCIGAACYPEGHQETPNRLLEIDLLKEKVDAGVDWLTTQLFFDNHEFYDFRARCELAGIDIPILAGIMPITSRKGMVRMAELSPGTRFPADLLRALGQAADDGAVSETGLRWATDQARDLVANGADGLHFYTLNRSKPTLRIYENLALRDRKGMSSRRLYLV